MDPDGNYESRPSAKFVLPAEPTDADAAEKEIEENIMDAKKQTLGQQDLDLSTKSDLPFKKSESDFVGPSAPPLSCRQLSVDEANPTTCNSTTIFAGNYAIEPPGLKQDSIGPENTVTDSVVIPTAVDGDVPVVAVPIVTSATGAGVATSPTSVIDNTNAATSCTPNEIIETTQNAPRPTRMGPRIHPSPDIEQNEVESEGDQPGHHTKKDSPKKCTPCRAALCAAVVVFLFMAIGGGLAYYFLRPDETEDSQDDDNGNDPKPYTYESRYPECHVFHPKWIGDGACNRGNYNTAECGWDGGDCLKVDWPDCHAEGSVAFRGLGNGHCNKAFDTIECGFDLGDCRPNWSSDDANRLKELITNYPECFFDGMDMGWIGDGFCDGGMYDREICGWDGGDCIVQGYPDCRVDEPDYISDGGCDGGQYNTEECGWDGGDCLEFNRQYPDCDVDSPEWLEDEVCDGGRYNTEECGWDGGDCLIAEWPNCHIDNPDGLGNGQCNKGSKADVVECGFDGGDCRPEMNLEKLKEVVAKYPGCFVDGMYLDWIGDGWCDTAEYATPECGWDGGDCEFTYGEDISCKGSVSKVFLDRDDTWCMNKCQNLGDECKAYDIHLSTGKCRIFSTYTGYKDGPGYECNWKNY